MMKKLFLSTILVLLCLSSALPLANADDTTADLPSDSTTETTVVVPIIPQSDFLPGPDQGTSGSDVQGYTLKKAIPKAINIGIALLGITAFIGILIAAIQMLTAYGDESKITRAKTNLKYGIFGFIVVILAYGIVSVVVSIALPNASSETGWHLIPTAYAVNVDEDVNLLLPDANDIIKDPSGEERVSLPNGDLLSQIVPAIITNIMYFVAFMIFIGFIYGGSIMVIGRGNEEEITKAKNIVLYSTIALVLISMGYAIIYGIATLNLKQDTTTENDDVFTGSQVK